MQVSERAARRAEVEVTHSARRAPPGSTSSALPPSSRRLNSKNQLRLAVTDGRLGQSPRSFRQTLGQCLDSGHPANTAHKMSLGNVVLRYQGFFPCEAQSLLGGVVLQSARARMLLKHRKEAGSKVRTPPPPPSRCAKHRGSSISLRACGKLGSAEQMAGS